MLNVNCHNPEILGVSVSQIHGGERIDLWFNQNVVQNIRWLADFRKKHEKELQMRENSPMLQEAYESYQTLLALTQE
jgi:hypothetical protein